MSYTIDPTVPPNSENPQNGATRIRNLAGELLQVLGFSGAAPQTIASPAGVQIDVNTGLFLVQSLPGATQLLANPDAVSPTTTIDVTAGFVSIINPSTFVCTLIQNFAANCVVVGPQAGSAANGRDQAGAFGANQFFHLYIIGGGGQTPATLASLTAPNTGPALPTNYTSWAYIGTFLTNGSGNLIPMYLRGNAIHYTSSQQLPGAGNATSPTAVTISSFVPAIATNFHLYFHSFLGVFGSSSPAIEIGLTSTTDSAATSFYEIKPAAYNNTGGVTGASGWTLLPNITGGFFYRWVLNGGSGQSADFEILGYTVPNASS